MQRIEHLAFVSVSRACGFGAIAILTFMVGLSGQMLVSLKAGGFLSFLMCMILLLKAWNAPSRPYKQTELWLMLSPEERPRSDVAQQIVSTALRGIYMRFAMHTAIFSALLLAMAVCYSALGLAPQ